MMRNLSTQHLGEKLYVKLVLYKAILWLLSLFIHCRQKVWKTRKPSSRLQIHDKSICDGVRLSTSPATMTPDSLLWCSARGGSSSWRWTGPTWSGRLSAWSSSRLGWSLTPAATSTGDLRASSSTYSTS